MKMLINIYTAAIFCAVSAAAVQAADISSLPPLPPLPGETSVALPAPKTTATDLKELKLPDVASAPAMPASMPKPSSTDVGTPAKETTLPPLAPVTSDTPILPAKIPDTKTIPSPVAPLAATSSLPSPGIPELPALPALPLLNSAVPPLPTQPQEKKAAQEIPSPVTPKVKEKKAHAKKIKHENISVASIMPPRTYYRSERLPDVIYRKSYDRENRHLPVAYYEKDYDALVFVTAANDDINGLRALLNIGRSVDMVNAFGETPLMIAVKHNAINTAHLLMMRHADVSAALQLAMRSGNSRMIKLLQGMHGEFVQANAAQ